MSTTMTIDVSDELLEYLRRQSAQQGKTPESLVADYLANLNWRIDLVLRLVCA